MQVLFSRTRAFPRGRRLLTLGTVVAAMLVPASTASAHDNWHTVWGPGMINLANGGVSDNHHRVWARDMYADGRGVRTYYWTDRGGFDLVGDSNGAAKGIGSEQTYDGGRVTKYQVWAGDIPGGVFPA